MDKIRIGIDNKLDSGFISDQLAVIEDKVEIELYEDSDISFNSLEKEIADLLIMPLKMVPAILPDQLVIAGLTTRNHYQEILCIRSEAIDKTKPLRIKDQSKVGTQDYRQLIQLRSIRNDLNIELRKHGAFHFLELLEDGTLDACLLSQADLAWGKASVTDYYTIKMHPSELVPSPGEGTLALISFKDNIILRRLIQSIHDKETALCTNVERRLLKRFESNRSDIGAYCYRDSGSFYHAYASIKDNEEKAITVSCSQSTHLELDTRLYDLLIQKVQH